MAPCLTLLLISALCVRGQGIDWEALDKHKAETVSFDFSQPESHYVATFPVPVPGYGLLAMDPFESGCHQRSEMWLR
ncbi:hypothetical protein PG996_000610 [Apiospora saccharicola]|uniref:Uncharacterized protein n=1 Tax=Apiospora saccharicola TaxID=335842 RepID=A0ABR1WI43_9PEZI